MDQLNEAHEQGVVLGLANVSGIAQRLDIDELLLHHPDTFNLFLIALMEMQGLEVPWETPKEYAFSPEDKLSYFQIAGPPLQSPTLPCSMTLIINRYTRIAGHTMGWRRPSEHGLRQCRQRQKTRATRGLLRSRDAHVCAMAPTIPRHAGGACTNLEPREEKQH